MYPLIAANEKIAEKLGFMKVQAALKEESLDSSG